MILPFCTRESEGSQRKCNDITISIGYGFLSIKGNTEKHTENRGYFDAKVDQKLTKLAFSRGAIHYSGWLWWTTLFYFALRIFLIRSFSSLYFSTVLNHFLAEIFRSEIGLCFLTLKNSLLLWFLGNILFIRFPQRSNFEGSIRSLVCLCMQVEQSYEGRLFSTT